jgi:hypothetical protein
MEVMNRRQFLVELRRYLSFMTPEQRDAVINRYELIFDAAGPEGEREVIEELGSPIKLAIALSREQFKPASGAVPGETKKDITEDTAPDTEAFEGQDPSIEPIEPPGFEEIGELPEQEEEAKQPEDLPDAAEPAPEAPPEGEPTAEEKPTVEEEPAAAEPPEDEPGPQPDDQPKQDVEAEAPAAKERIENDEAPAEAEPESGIGDEAAEAEIPETEPPEIKGAPVNIPAPDIIKYDHTHEEEKRPRTFLSVLYSIFASIIGVIVSVAVIVICLALAAIPVALIGSGIYLLIAGISSFGYLPDALLILGAAGLALGLGLFVAWFVIWLCIITVRAVMTGFSALYVKLFKRGGGAR